MSVKQKIDEILKREGVNCFEFQDPVFGKPIGRLSIDAAYVQKLENLVRELGEVSEALLTYGFDFAVFDDDKHNNEKTGQLLIKSKKLLSDADNGQKAREALTRLNKLLDEMGAP